MIAALLRKLYGPKSERMDTEQLLMAFLEDEAKKPDAAGPDEDEPAAEPTPGKKKSRTSRLADSLRGLPSVERVIIDPEVLADPEAYRLIGEEVSERLHVQPAAFTLEIIRRQTHVRKGDPDATPITPPLEPCLLPGSVLSPSLGAYLLTEKFCYHQPFYRQEWKLRVSQRIELDRALMCSWHDHLAGRLLPLYDLLGQQFRSASYLQVDETPIRYLRAGSGKAQQGYFWVYNHPEHGVLYDWHASRANTCLDNILIGSDGAPCFQGYLQSDGLRAYRTFMERHSELDLTPVSCLTHIRRKFIEARDDHPRITAWVILLIGRIYRIEARLQESRAGPLERQRSRWLESRRIYDHLQKLFAHLQKRRSIVPKSALGKALAYACEQWPHLEPCFADGRIEWHNNNPENAIRPSKLGMKNWMFIGAEDTGWRSAVIYTFVEQVRSHGLDPYAYFEWVFDKLMHDPDPETYPDLLPTTWIRLQSAPSSAAEAAA